MLSEGELNRVKCKWVLGKKGGLGLSSKEIRDLVKYCICVIKIGGSCELFEILLGMYGLKCRIDEGGKWGYDGWLKRDG